MFERIQHLTAAMAAGDSAAIDAFYREYFDWMYAQARRATRRDESFCLDVVQDSVLRVIRNVKKVDCETRFRGWLRLVVQTTALDLLRGEARRKNRQAMAAGPMIHLDADSLQLDFLRLLLSELDAELVHLIELRYTQSLSLRQIGEKMGISTGAVDGRLRRALTKLKFSLQDPPDEPEPAPPAPIHTPSPDPSPVVETVASPQADPPVSFRNDTQPLQIESTPPIAVAMVDPTAMADRELQSPLNNGPDWPEVESASLISIAIAPALATNPDDSIHSFADGPQGRAALAENSPLVDHSIVSEPEPLHAPVAMPQEIESHAILELVGLEDEAGAYDDCL